MLDLSYLHGTPRPPEVRVGVAFDGQRLGLVAYAVANSMGMEVVHRNEETGGKVLDHVRTPLIFGAYSNDQIYFPDVVKTIECYQPSMVILGGSTTGKSILGVELKTIFSGVKIKEFYKTPQGRLYTLPEIISSVIADIRSERIVISPLFEGRPEREMLRTELSSVEPRMGSLSPVQEAFLFGIGLWSCSEQRKKYQSGGTSFHVY
jgi:hypothetical protein